MVEILCPHCDEEIALDDDASGEFSCPYCNGDFEWNTEPTATSSRQHKGEGGSIVDHPIQWIGHGFTLFMMLFLLMFFFSSGYYSCSFEGETGVSYDRKSETTMGVTMEYSAQVDMYDAEYNACMTEDVMEGYEEFCNILDAYSDYYSSWRAAGLSITIMYALAMICSVIAISGRGIMMLERTQVVEVSYNLLTFSYLSSRFIPFVISGLMILGTLLFMLIAPTGDFPGMADMPAIDGSFGFIIWSSFLLALLYIGVNVFDMKVS